MGSVEIAKVHRTHVLGRSNRGLGFDHHEFCQCSLARSFLLAYVGAPSGAGTGPVYALGTQVLSSALLPDFNRALVDRNAPIPEPDR